MKNFMLISVLIIPLFVFSQNKSQTAQLGFGLHCGVGSGRCIEVGMEMPEFDVSMPNDNTLILSLPIAQVTEDFQLAILGKTFNQFLENEPKVVIQNQERRFTEEECSDLGIRHVDGFGVEKGNHLTFIQNETYFVILTIKKM